MANTHFNPRSDERSDGKLLQVVNACSVISIHAPTNGATRRMFKGTDRLLFQSTLRRTERPGNGLCVTVFLNFNPRSDERSDGDGPLFSIPLVSISIHAPTNGATWCSQPL